MSDTAVSLLTAPGTGAIATVEVRGPRAWELARQLFKPAGKPLPESPEVHRFWFGTLGSDEVILAVTSNDTIEVHCHGGRRVVRWVMDQFLANGGHQPPECEATECATSELNGDSLGGLTPPARLLEQAPTLRTASIILDQLNGAFANEVRRILALIETDPRAAAESLSRLAMLGDTIGRHLIEPWKVVIAGPPNVGKSSLINALAGYQRSVVSEVAGTTRDSVSVQVAFDGWPVVLIDTAGLRAASGLEAEGIERARDEWRRAHFRVWVIDSTDPQAQVPDVEALLIANKCDLPAANKLIALRVSARTGAGIAQFVRALVKGIPDVEPGAAIPYTPRTIDLVNVAAFVQDWDEASQILREAIE